jgi:hypothetical protein
MNGFANAWMDWISGMTWQLTLLIALIAAAAAVTRRASARL